MDPVSPSSYSTPRHKQSPTPLGSSPGLLTDPIAPASPSGLDTALPAPVSTATRLPNYRRIAAIPRKRRSPPFSKRLTCLLRFGRDPNEIATSSALTSSSLAADDSCGDCNGLSTWSHNHSSLAAIEEIKLLTSAETPPPPTTSSSADDEIQPPLTTTSSSVDTNPAPFTAQELGLANLIMWYRSILMFGCAAFFIYNEHDYPAVMISEIAGTLCIYMHFWSLHITQFWLNHDEDLSSPIVMLWCLTVFMFALIIRTQHSVLAGMCITLLTTMCMAGYLISCIHEYNCTRRRQNLEHPLDSYLHQDEHTLDS